MKIVTVVVFVYVVCVNGDVTTKDRQKRLLFYDEEGNLVKTYSNPYPNNPYLQNLRYSGRLPFYGSFLNPFFGFIKDIGSIFTFTIPVSNQVIQQIQRDPNYHNQLILTHRDPTIEPNPLCDGKRTQIPSPKLCNNYLNCWDGWAVEQECPNGLLFSSQGYCDYSDNVNCGSRSLREQPPTQPECHKDFEAFRNALDCNEFFVCVGRQPVKFKCPADLAYNQLLGVCDYPSRVDCSSTATNPAVYPQSNPVKPAAPTPDAPAIFQESPSSPVVPSVPPVPSVPSVPFVPSVPSVPSVPAVPVLPSQQAVSSVPALPSVPAVPSAPTEQPSSSEPVAPTITFGSPSLPIVFSENSFVNTQKWTSTQVAISRQDAIRQLQRENIGKVDI